MHLILTIIAFPLIHITHDVHHNLSNSNYHLNGAYDLFLVKLNINILSVGKRSHEQSEVVQFVYVYALSISERQLLLHVEPQNKDDIQKEKQIKQGKQNFIQYRNTCLLIWLL